jgi:hypothetical protein
MPPFLCNTQFHFTCSSLLLHKSLLVHVMSLFTIVQWVAYLLIAWPTLVWFSSASFFSFFFYHQVYGGYGDCNNSFAFKSLHLSVFFLLLCTLGKGRNAVGFSTWNTENTQAFYNSEALHIIKIVQNISDYSDRLAGFRMVLVINATKAEDFWHHEHLMKALTFFSCYFSQECNLVYTAENFTWCYQFGSIPPTTVL